jgi:uncharacterized protein
LELQALIETQGYNWADHFANFADNYAEKSTEWTYENHVVNHAMAIKEACFRAKGTMEAMQALDMLDKYHEQANGMFSGDESLAGISPFAQCPVTIRCPRGG